MRKMRLRANDVSLSRFSQKVTYIVQAVDGNVRGKGGGRVKGCNNERKQGEQAIDCKA